MNRYNFAGMTEDSGGKWVRGADVAALLHRIAATIDDDALACTFQTMGQYRAAMRVMVLMATCGLDQPKP